MECIAPSDGKFELSPPALSRNNHKATGSYYLQLA